MPRPMRLATAGLAQDDPSGMMPRSPRAVHTVDEESYSSSGVGGGGGAITGAAAGAAAGATAGAGASKSGADRGSKRRSHLYSPSADASQPYTYHRRDKTKSTQSYVQPYRRDAHASGAAVAAAVAAATGTTATRTGAGGATMAQRPIYSERAYSAPHVPRDKANAHDGDGEADSGSDEDIAGDEFFQQYAAPGAEAEAGAAETPAQSDEEEEEQADQEGPLSPTSNTTRFRPDSVAEPLGSPLLPAPVTFAGRMYEINIAVLGATGVGKSSYIQRVFDHRAPPTLTVTPRKMSIDGEEYTVRLIELTFDELEFDDDNRIEWPVTADHRPFPPIDGVLTLYNVMDKESLTSVPETLRAVYQSKLPFHLVACKCDYHPNLRQIDPSTVGQRAKALIGNVNTYETSQNQPGTQKRCLHALLRVIVNDRYDHAASTTASARKRATSQIPVPHAAPKHNRASSELSGSLRRAQQYTAGAFDPVATTHPSRSRSTQHPPATAAAASASAAAAAATSSNQLQQPDKNWLNLNNATSHDTLKTATTGTSGQSAQSGRSAVSARSAASARSTAAVHPAVPTHSAIPASAGGHEATAGTVLPERPSLEKGYTWDQLIDRLLQQHLSKTDQKFVAIFLALYRSFAAPGQLLEAILRRFNEVSLNDATPEMSRTVIQLRHLKVLEQWISTYPGDFAHPATRSSMCRFVALIANTRIFSAAAREIAADLEVIAEDDEAIYACSDKHRARPDTTLSFMSEASTLHDENFEDLIHELSGMNFTGAMNQTAPISPAGPSAVPSGLPTNSITISSSGQTVLAAVEAAAVQARTLRPSGRIGLTKVLWHALEETPDELVARELTRMDWILFMSIRPRDLVRHVSLNSEQKKSCRSLENVNRMISHFNHLACWVANFVLLRDKPKQRSMMLEKFMRIARKLRELNNYNSLGAIIAGINSTSVHRLNATRELLNSLIVRDFMKLEILMGTQKSHFAYRLAWENSPGGRIPYIPLHRRDLVTAIEGNKTWMEGGEKMDGPSGQQIRRYISDGQERINWKKFEIMGEVIFGVQTAQAVPFPRFAKNDTVRESVMDVRLIKDDDELYARSVQLESSGASHDKKKLSNWFQRGASNAASMLVLPSVGTVSAGPSPPRR